jgi:hypothetical protein
MCRPLKFQTYTFDTVEAATMTTANEPITPQAAGAFGEKAVEAELLRHKWMPANVNPTVKNAAKFDIFAWKANRAVRISVKTCRPNMTAVLFPYIKDKIASTVGVEETDFTIVVRMGNEREKDQFFVVPTKVVLTEIRERQLEHRARGVKDIGMWHFSFAPRKDDKPEGGRDIERKWGKYLGNWEGLDG